MLCLKVCVALSALTCLCSGKTPYGTPSCLGQDLSNGIGDTCERSVGNPSRGTSLLSLAANIKKTRLGGDLHENYDRASKRRPKMKIKTKGKVGRGMGGGSDAGHSNSRWRSQINKTLACGVSDFAPSSSRCPETCSFLSPDTQVGCHWRCVPKESCGVDDPDADVADEQLELCRRCFVAGCKRCVPGEDRCSECMFGYDLVDGACQGSGRLWWFGFFIALGVCVVMVLIWYVFLLCRPVINQDVLDDALAHRKQCCLRDHSDDHHPWHPLTSNLSKMPEDGNPPIGGPGCLLLFRFQLWVIAWIVLTVAGWLLFGYFLGGDLFRLGTSNVGDDLEMCRAVHWGGA